jgi:CubicO group peptidase (beta-lactamase class C family)
LAVLVLEGLAVDGAYPEPVLLTCWRGRKNCSTRGDAATAARAIFLLGIQRVTDMSVGAYAQEHFFAPLGMTHTAYHRDPERIGTNFAVGHVPDGAGKYRRTYVALDTRDLGIWNLRPWRTCIDGIRISSAARSEARTSTPSG